MAVDDVLNDCEAQRRAAALAAALHIYAIKPLRQARNGFTGDPLAIVFHRDGDHRAGGTAAVQGGRARRLCKTDRDLPAHAAIFDRVVNEVLKELDELVALA